LTNKVYIQGLFCNLSAFRDESDESLPIQGLK
jgi:hypothetical protein